MVARLKVGRLWSGAYEAGIQAAGLGDVGGSLDQGAAVGENGDDVIAALESKQKVVEADLAVGLESCFHFREINWPVVFMNLDGIAAAKRDVRAAFAAQMSKIALLADFTVGARPGGCDFGSLVRP
jgi:hypothetical protein